MAPRVIRFCYLLAGLVFAGVTLFGTGRGSEIATVSPSLIDSDQDGMPTLWEIVHWLDPDDPSDAILDPDGDNYNNRSEFRAGTDPHSAESVLRFSKFMQIASNEFFLQFQAVPNRAYSVVYRTDTQSTNWIKIRDFEAASLPWPLHRQARRGNED